MTRFVALIALLGALIACTPPSAMPPPVPMAANSGVDLGVAGVTTYGYSFLDYAADLEDDTTRYGDAQAWMVAGRQVQVGVVASLGGSQLVTAGALVRYMFLRNPRYRLGVQVDAGWAWGRVGMPVAAKLGPGFWVWSYPALATPPNAVLYGSAVEGVNRIPTMQLPVGISFRPRQAPWGLVHLETGYRRFVVEDQWHYKVYAALGFSLQPRLQDGPRRQSDGKRPPPR